MVVEAISKLFYENELLGYRFKIREESGISLFDIDRDVLMQNLGTSVPRFNADSTIKLVMHEGMLKSQAEIRGQVIVGDLESNKQVLNFVIGVLVGDLGNTVNNDISKAFNTGIKKLDISNDIFVNPDSYNYKGLGITDIMCCFEDFSELSEDNSVVSYEFSEIYYEPDRDFWYCTANIEEGEDTVTNKVFVMKIGSREEALAKLQKFEGKKTTKQNAKVLKKIVSYVKNGQQLIPIQFKCNWAGSDAFDKFDNGIKKKIRVWRA